MTRADLNRIMEQARRALSDGLPRTAGLYAAMACDMEHKLAMAEGRDPGNPFPPAEAELHCAVADYLASTRTAPFPASRTITVATPGADLSRWVIKAGTTHAARSSRED